MFRGMINRFQQTILTNIRDELEMRGTFPRVNLEAEYRVWASGDVSAITYFYRTIHFDIYDPRRFYFYRITTGRIIHSDAPRSVTNAMAKIKLGKSYDIVIDDDTNLEILNDVLQDNAFNALAQRAAKEESIMGECVYKLRVNLDRLIIEVIPFEAYTPMIIDGQLVSIRFLVDTYHIRKDTFHIYEIYNINSIYYEVYKETSDGERIVSFDDAELNPDDYPEFFHNFGFVPAVIQRNNIDSESDYKGLISEFDALDDAWSQYFTVIRKSAPITYATKDFFHKDSQGNLKPFVNPEQIDILMMDKPVGENAKPEIHSFHPKIDADSYRKAIELITDNITTTVGISRVTMGYGFSGESGLARKELKVLTIGSYNQHAQIWTQSLQTLFTYILLMKGIDTEVKVIFPEYVSSVDEVATRVQSSVQSKTMSIKTAVKEQHPDWTQAEIDAEVQAIYLEQGINVGTNNVANNS